MTGGPTCGGNGAGSGRRKTVSCWGQDESYAAGIATEVPVSPAWLSHHPHVRLFSNALAQADAACGVSPGAMGSAAD